MTKQKQSLTGSLLELVTLAASSVALTVLLQAFLAEAARLRPRSRQHGPGDG